MDNFTQPSLLIPALRRDLMCRAQETLAARLSSLDVSPVLVYDIDHVAASALPHLAEQFGMSELLPLCSTDADKRVLLKIAPLLNRKKGSVWALREVIRRVGLGGVTLIEGQLISSRDGSVSRNGWRVHGDKATWANLRVVLAQPCSAKQGVLLRSILVSWIPARCHLLGIEFATGGFMHNKIIYRNGLFNYGGV